MALSIRQRIMKLIYPLLLLAGKKKTRTPVQNGKVILPFAPFHSLSVTLNNGKSFSLDTLKGKKIMIVNTASDCGYTAQYTGLQALYQQAAPHLEIIGFPANDFKEQERGSDEEIAAFCAVNFGVSFPLAKKSSVVKSAAQNPVFAWLGDKAKNGWNDKAPEWNFSKYLINEAGILTHYFPPSVSPLSAEVLAAVGK